MKNLWTLTLALGAIYTLETTQQAKAESVESPSPNIHLVRGGGGHAGGHGMDRGLEGHNMGDRGEGVAANRDVGAGNVGTDHPAAAEDRMHTLDNNLRNNEGWGGEGWGDGEWGCTQTDDQGNCISYH